MGKTVKVLCDNLPTVSVLQSVLEAARQAWMVQAIFQVSIIYEHIPGRLNTLADTLSRAHLSLMPKRQTILFNCWDCRGFIHVYMHSQPLNFRHPTDPRLQTLSTMALTRQDLARAHGTNSNRRSAVKNCLQFCHHFRWFPLSLTYQQMCMYVEHLNMKGLAPLTVRNHLGHVRTYLQLAEAPPVANHNRVERALHLQATKRRKDYTKKQRPPPNSTVISAAIQALPPNKEYQAVKAAVLMIFYGAFRQGEVVPQTMAAFDPLRHLTRADVKVFPNRLDIIVKAAKNLQRYDQRHMATVFKADDPNMCLVGAVNKVVRDSPTVSPNQPMFVFSGSTRPISASYVRTQWTAALKLINAPHEQFTLHTLRKAAVSIAYQSRLGERTVKHYGKWASDAYKT